MVGGLETEGREQRLEAAKEAVRAELSDFSEEERETFLGKGYPPYWLSFDPATQARHARLMRAADREGRSLTIDTRIDPGRAITEVTIYTHDHPGLFSRLAGALAVAGANIVDAKIFTQTDGMALDLFTVQDAGTGGAFDAADKLARLSVAVDKAVAGRLDPERELARQRPAWPTRTRVFTVQPRVLIDNEASRTHTVIEINGRDRPGLLYDVTRALTNLGLQISSARISTYGERAVDVFYVKDVFGLKDRAGEQAQPDPRTAARRVRRPGLRSCPDPGHPAPPPRPLAPPPGPAAADGVGAPGRYRVMTMLASALRVRLPPKARKVTGL